MSGKSSVPSTTTQTNITQPWAGQQPYLSDVFSQAQNLYNTNTPQYYPGQTVAGQTPATTQAQDYMMNLAQTQMPGYAQNVMGASNFALNAPDINNNPAFQSAVSAAINPAVRGFQTAVMPTIRADFGQGENYGSSRRAIATGLASEALSNNIFNTAATMGNQAYNAGLDAQGRAIALSPSVLQNLQQPALAMDVVGQQQQAYQQDLINAEIQKWNFQETAPWQALTQYQNLIQGNYGGQSYGTTTAPSPQSNKAMSAIGGAMGGAALGGMIAGASGGVIGGPVGMGVGALAGLIIGMM